MKRQDRNTQTFLYYIHFVFSLYTNSIAIFQEFYQYQIIH
jgi:hypothetical protein